ncbi:unnamed protein product [Diatraea saccharalis]|uniref:Peptidase S1 domain-containing protein n=1 Tax=Diatraea saccharalis TaxID=40085 RepID=A0A9N9R3D0_9NEOP|nr:unnamed protein product [Diatraea saccharalis]
MQSEKLLISLLFLNLGGKLNGRLQWDRTKCAPDTDQSVPEGFVDNIGRFSWLGVIQHTFTLGGDMRYAVTTGVLVHPFFVLAPVEDIAKIPPESLRNNTKFVIWQSQQIKYVLDVKDYSLHPEFSSGTTWASVALLELYPSPYIGFADVKDPILPVCLNLEGVMPLTDLYAIQITDARGAGCGAPARFIFMPSYLQWIEEVISMEDIDAEDRDDETYKIYYRRLSPIKFVMMKGTVRFRRVKGMKTRRNQQVRFETRLPTFHGDCERGRRGHVLFKDASELLVNKNFVQGFYLVSVAMVAQMRCAVVTVASLQRTNAAVWVEHHCHREISGLEPNQRRGPDYRKALIEITMFGEPELHTVADPFHSTYQTDQWNPTTQLFKWGNFLPQGIGESWL